MGQVPGSSPLLLIRHSRLIINPALHHLNFLSKVMPPTMLDPLTTVEDGLLKTELKWEHFMPLKEGEQTRRWYTVSLNNMDLNIYEVQLEPEETSLLVNLTMAEGWNTTYSVVTHLGEVESAATAPRRLFPESVRPGPPQQVIPNRPDHFPSNDPIP